MFSKMKEYRRIKKLPSRYVNETFGEVGYCAGFWETTSGKDKITLWNQSFDIVIMLVALEKDIFINEYQENAYKKFIDTITVRQNEVENLMENHFQTHNKDILLSKYIPQRLVIGRSGECGLCGENTDDEDEGQDVPMGLCVCFYPELELITEEEFTLRVMDKTAQV